MNHMHQLCYPWEDKIQTLKRLQEEINKYSSFDPSKNQLTPEITRLFPLRSIAIRLSILYRVYKDDYHTDSFDIDRLSKRIIDNNELIWFWGSQENMNYIQNYLSPETVQNQFLAGTVTAINVNKEFGPGTAELCRSGSTDTIVKGKLPILHRTLSYLTDKNSLLYKKFHTLCLVPRTRKSTEDIRGGEAVNTIHNKYLRSRFWGYAPWYVMQGGFLEFLEFREINRDVADVIQAIKLSSNWYIADDKEADVVRNLCILNFNLTPPLVNASNYFPNRLVSIPYLHLKCSDEKIRLFNHETIICYPDENSESYDLIDGDKFFSLLEATECSCKVVRLNLLDERSIFIQKILKHLGFKFSMMSPPKVSWVMKNDKYVDITLPPYGYWSFPNPKYIIEPPFYFKYRRGSSTEEQLVNYFSREFLENENI
jgi:hypothetical protein